MPKFKVNVTETISVYYKTIVIEAADKDDAEVAAEEMATNEQLEEGRSKSDYDCQAELVS